MSGTLLDSLRGIMADAPTGVHEGAAALTRKDLFAEKKRHSWQKDVVARCDFTPRRRLVHRGVWFHSLWQKSLMGPTLAEIKADDAEIRHFAVEMADFIRVVLGCSLGSGGWALITSPKRRHKERNFATLICQAIAPSLGIPFCEDVAECRTKERINATFSLLQLPPEPNLIVFDDFVTTGSTLRAMENLLKPLGKNMVFFAGVNNAL